MRRGAQPLRACPSLQGFPPNPPPPPPSTAQGEYWRRVQEQPIHFAGPAWHGVSPGALALLSRMLDRDCSKRITAAQALQDPWIVEMTGSSTPRSTPAPASAAPSGWPEALSGSCSNAVSSPWHHSAGKAAPLQRA